MSASADYTEAKPRTRKKASHLDLFESADQGRVCADLSTFFGPQAETFLQTYQKMRSAKGGARLQPRTWCWPAFFGSFTWFFYRKMYAHGAMIIFLPFIFIYLFRWVGGSTILLPAVWAKGWYVNHGLDRVSKADELGLTGAERTDYLRRAGGVSLPAGIFAGFVYACLLAVVVLALIGGQHAGH